MRYLYRSYCLKEGGIWSGQLRAQRWKTAESERNPKEKKAREVENLIEKKQRVGCRGKFEQSGLVVMGVKRREGAGGLHGPIYHWGIYTYWLKSTTRQTLKGPRLFLGGELSVHFLLGLQHVPLGDGSPGVGQHVGPVAQLRPRAVEAHKDLADGIVLADLVIVQNSYNNLHFL